MAKARKEGKPKKNRRNLVKKLKAMAKTHELIKKFENNG